MFRVPSTMERLFMPRARAIALIVEARRHLLAKADEHSSDEARHMRQSAVELERLLLDVRAGRVSAFELAHPVTIHVTVSAD